MSALNLTLHHSDEVVEHADLQLVMTHQFKEGRV